MHNDRVCLAATAGPSLLVALALIPQDPFARLLCTGLGIYAGLSDEEAEELRVDVHGELKRLEKAGETIDGQLDAGRIDATRAAQLRQIEGKSNGGSNGGKKAGLGPPPPVPPPSTPPPPSLPPPHSPSPRWQARRTRRSRRRASRASGSRPVRASHATLACHTPRTIHTPAPLPLPPPPRPPRSSLTPSAATIPRPPHASWDLSFTGTKGKAAAAAATYWASASQASAAVVAPASEIRYFYTICEATGCDKCSVNIKPMAASWKHARCPHSQSTPQMIHDPARGGCGKRMGKCQCEGSCVPLEL